MILKDKIAVAYRFMLDGQRCNKIHEELMTAAEYAALQRQAETGHVVILEAWTLGKCISN